MHLTNHVNEDDYNVSNQGGLYASGMKYHCDNILLAFASLYRWEWRKECGSCHIPNYQVGCQVTQLRFVNLSWKAKSKHTKEGFIMYHSFPPKRVKGGIWCLLTMRRGGHFKWLCSSSVLSKKCLACFSLDCVFGGGKPVRKIVWGKFNHHVPCWFALTSFACWLLRTISWREDIQTLSDRKSEPRGWVGTISNRYSLQFRR